MYQTVSSELIPATKLFGRETGLPTDLWEIEGSGSNLHCRVAIGFEIHTPLWVFLTCLVGFNLGMTKYVWKRQEWRLSCKFWCEKDIAQMSGFGAYASWGWVNCLLFFWIKISWKRYRLVTHFGVQCQSEWAHITEAPVYSKYIPFVKCSRSPLGNQSRTIQGCLRLYKVA